MPTSGRGKIIYKQWKRVEAWWWNYKNILNCNCIEKCGMAQLRMGEWWPHNSAVQWTPEHEFATILVFVLSNSRANKLTLKSFYCHHLQAESLLYIRRWFKAFDMVCCSSLGLVVTAVFLRMAMRIVCFLQWGCSNTGAEPGQAVLSPVRYSYSLALKLALLWGRCWPSGPLPTWTIVLFYITKTCMASLWSIRWLTQRQHRASLISSSPGSGCGQFSQSQIEVAVWSCFGVVFLVQ